MNPYSNFLTNGQTNLLRRRIEEVVRDHKGPLFSLDHRLPLPISNSTLASFGLARDEASCEVVRSTLDTDAMRVCRLQRVEPPGVDR